MGIGAVLQSKRLERQLSIADVSRETKIQPWILTDLEADRLEERMSPIYMRGFIATYARFLKVPVDPLLEQLPRGETTTDIISENQPQEIPAASTAPVFSPRLLAKPALALAGLVAVVWLNPIGLLGKLNLPAINAPQTAGFTAGSVEAVGVSQLKIKPSTPLTLAIAAKRPTWVQLWSDGKLLVQQRLEAGQSERWKANSDFRLIVAKPAHVDVQLNQNPITSALVGFKGRVSITHDGVKRLEPSS